MNAILFAQPLKVTLNGLDTRAHTMFDMFLRGPARGVCDVVGEDSAEAAIFDLDGIGGERLWHSFRERFHGPALVLSVREKHLHNAVWVRKPLSGKDFLEAIELVKDRLYTERRLHEIEDAVEDVALAITATPAAATAEPVAPPLAAPVAVARSEPQGDSDGVSRAASLAWSERQVHECCGALDDAIYLDPKRRDELFYEPEDYVQGLLQRACGQAGETGKPIRLEVMGLAMFVLPDRSEVFSEIREPVLRPLCVTPTPNRQGGLRILDSADLAAQMPKLADQDPRLQSYERMLWLLALWASRGRVPKGTDPDVAVALPRWPNFSRILITPHAMQIAALWSNRPTSLMQTAKLLSIPHRYVFAFYSACVATGLIGRAVVAAPAVGGVPASSSPVTAPEPAAKRSLLGSLLRKLKLTR
jgi:hypothetical protein